MIRAGFFPPGFRIPYHEFEEARLNDLPGLKAPFLFPLPHWLEDDVTDTNSSK
jgi:hypothetical protein